MPRRPLGPIGRWAADDGTAACPALESERVGELLAEHGLEFSPVAFYDNNPHGSRPDRAAEITTVMR
jgi:hypothetical protein